MKECPNCGELLGDNAEKCFKCRYDFTLKKNIKVTTGYNFEGYDIIDYKDVISREIVVGTGFLSELNAEISDILGTRASGYEGKIAQSKSAVLNILKNDAEKLNANGIIGINFDITTIGNNMIIVSANGTAVEISKKID